MKKKSLVLKIAALCIASAGFMFAKSSMPSVEVYAMENNLNNFGDFLRFKEYHPNLNYKFDLDRFKCLMKQIPGIIDKQNYINNINNLEEQDITFAFCGEIKLLMDWLTDFINFDDNGNQTFEFTTLGVKNFSFKINKLELKNKCKELDRPNHYKDLFTLLRYIAFNRQDEILIDDTQYELAK